MDKLLEFLQALTQISNELIQDTARNWALMGSRDKFQALQDELRDKYPGMYPYLIDTFDDALVAAFLTEGKSRTYKIPFLIKNGVATFGSPLEVERIVTYEKVTEVESESEDATEQTEVVTYNLLQGTDPVQVPLVGEINQASLLFTAEDLAQAAKSKDGSIKFQNAVATVFEIKNANQQYYPASIWQSNLEQLNERAKKNMCIGQADHPKPGEDSILRQCIRFDSFAVKDNTVVCSGEIIATQAGQSLIELAKNGIPIGLSSRGKGTLVLKQMNGENVFVVQDDFYCDTFDAVSNPAAKGSYIQGEGKVSQTAKTENSLTQSIEGESKVNKTLKKLLMELGQARMMAEGGNTVAATLAEEYEALEQMAVSGGDENWLAGKLGPLSTRLGAIQIMKPSDPDANKPSSNGAYFQSAEPAAPALTQAALGLSQAEVDQFKQNLTSMNQMVLNQAVDGAIGALDPLVQNFVRTQIEPMKSTLTVDQVATKVEELAQSVRTLLVSNGVQFHTAGVGRTEHEKVIAQAPKTVEDMVQELTKDMEDTVDSATGKIIQGPGSVKYGTQTMLRNTAREDRKAFQGYMSYRRGELAQAVADGDLSTADLASGQAALFPLIRATFPRLLAHKIASVQPISSPSASIYYIKAKNEDGAILADNPYYYTYSNGIAELVVPKKIELEITKEDITVTGKKLTSKASYEVIQDMQNQFGLDALKECVTAQAEEIARERNNQILFDLAFASNMSGNVTFGKTAASGYTQQEWNREQMAVHLESVSNLVYMNRFEDITDVFASPAVCLQFQKMGSQYGFVPNSSDQNNIYSGVNIFGTVNSRVRIWKVPFYEAIFPNKALCLYKGTDWKDTALVYAPYAMAVTPEIHSVDFGVQQGIMERSAQKIVQPKCLATLTFSATTGTAL